MDALLRTQDKEGSATHGSYLKLRELILTGILPPGQKLKIEQLRGMLNTGASPVREALSLLTSDMLVERIDQRGFRAAPVSKAHFEEILMLRCTLEAKALQGAITAADATWEEQLVLAHHHMKRAGQNGAEAFEDAHKAFHMALITHAANPLMARYCAQLYDLNIRYRFLAAGESRYRERSIEQEHQDILDATIERRAQTAIDLLVSHYRRTGEYLSKQMEA